MGADSVLKKLGNNGTFCITNLVLYDSISGSAPEANDKGNLSISGSGRSNFEIDTKNFKTLHVGTITGNNSTISVNNVTTNSNAIIDLTDVNTVTISFSFSISASKDVTYGNGSASNSGTTTISSLIFE